MARDSIINPVANDDSTGKTNMMDLWRQSMERTQKQRETPTQVMQSEAESRTDLEQKIRNGEVECPTCAARTYQDESNDGGVSFQAATHLNAATAGMAVMNHESEHVARGASESDPNDPEEGVVKNSTVSLEHKKCPDCGRTYVAGGLTKTTSRPASYNPFKKPGELDTLA